VKGRGDSDEEIRYGMKKRERGAHKKGGFDGRRERKKRWGSVGRRVVVVGEDRSLETSPALEFSPPREKLERVPRKGRFRLEVDRRRLLCSSNLLDALLVYPRTPYIQLSDLQEVSRPTFNLSDQNRSCATTTSLAKEKRKSAAHLGTSKALYGEMSLITTRVSSI